MNKRTRDKILKCLEKGPHSISQISHRTSMSWDTVARALGKFIEDKLVRELPRTEVARIFELVR